MWSLGSCGRHVLDAVSQCEQEVRRQGKDEKHTPWKLSIRKELFTPWHDSTSDPISTDLIYRQVIKGIKSGEYTSEKEDEYVQMAAKHYYIQYGSGANRDNIQKVVEECITTTLIENKSKARWVQLISAALTQSPYTDGKQKTDTVKGELVEIARQKWPIHFSKFYEVTMTSGPALNKSRFVVAVNWSGIFFTDERDRRLVELPYLEVKDVQVMSEIYLSTKSVRLVTVQGEFVLKSVDALDMAALIEENLEGLMERSEFALVQSDTSKSDDDLFLACKRGDLVLVKKDEDYLPDQNWIRATNQRTNNTGAVYKDTLQFLPTLSRPSEDILELLSPGQKRTSAQSAPQRDDAVAPVSLRDFARENFRQPGKDVGRHGANKGFNKEKLWSHSREPIKQPLMKSLVRNSELSALACNAFTAIMKYMGDYPIKVARSPIELTDQIFGPATQHDALQDEIYCQIMRQMTTNNSRLSRERGWQLMWLVTGLFPPSPNLITHTRRFLESRPRESLAAGCLQRLQAMLSKEPRKLPPHLVEVDAIQQNSTQIFHKVHFPDERDEIFAVASTTTIKDLCYTVASQLKLKSAEGYGLYLKTANKGGMLQSLNEEKYLFDSLRETSDAPKKAKKVKEGKPGYQANAAYMVIFKRKLWFNVSPGKDLIADLTCHFPQELYKYLRGYHNCTKEDMFTLGGLLFRAEVDSDRSQFVMIPKMLKSLVPADQLDMVSKEEWKKHIISSYNKQSGTSVQEAKIAFLRIISSWPTFGCDFFEVKQTCESSYPNMLWVAINKYGVSLIDPKTKEILIVHPFSRITECHSRGDVFQMTIGTLVKGVTFVCETARSYTMEDLLRSYVNMYENQRKGFQSKISMFS